MELKLYRDTKVTIGLTEKEAKQLLALLAVPSRDALPIADQLYDALIVAAVTIDVGAADDLDVNLKEIYST